MSIDRYPGPRSFESNEQAIFRGRTSEIKDLLDLIRLEQVLVLFSKSGLGKSSLLNAGVGPALPAFDYQPIRVRFQIFNTQSANTTDATDTTPLNSTIEYIISEYSAAYALLQKKLDNWQLEMAQLPNGNGEKQAKQQAELERVIQQQLESLSAEHPLTDEQLAEFKQKQREITDQPPTETNRRVKLNSAIETAGAAMSATTLSFTDEKELKYSPRTTIDPFGKPAAGRLWETLKLYPFPNGAAPVFFFDQFEEFFAAPSDAQGDFLTQLAEVLCDQPPRRISERIAQELSSADPGQHASPSQRTDVDKDRITELVAWGRQPAVKCVFAIRDDRLAEIDSLESFIPLVLKNRYKLNPLNGNNARLAIVEPAAAIGDFITPPFSYADQNVPDDEPANTLQLIIDGLSNDKGEIDSTQLQMVCNNIETAVEKARKETPEKIVFEDPGAGPTLRVDKRLIPDEQTIKTFISEFYATRLNTVGNATDVDLAGSILENHFVLNGKRIGIDKPVLEEYLGKDGLLISQLIKSRLIRPEPTSRGIAYELSHDKLVEPVEQARQVRIRKELDEKKNLEEAQQRRKERIWAIGVISFLLLAIGLGIYFFNMQKKYEGYYANSVNLTAKQQYDLGRYGVAYRMWIDEEDSTGKVSEKSLFAPFAGQEFAYDDQQRYVAVRYKDDSIAVFERTKDSTYHRIALPGSIQKSIQFSIAGQHMVVISGNDSIQKVHVIDLPTRRILFSDSSQGIFNPESVLLSPKGNYMLLTDKLYVPHLFKLLPGGSYEDCNFNLTGSKAGRTLRFLPNETGCYFVSERNLNRTYTILVSNFKWDTTFTDIMTYKVSASGKTLLLTTKVDTSRNLSVLNLVTKQVKRFLKGSPSGTITVDDSIVLMKKPANGYGILYADLYAPAGFASLGSFSTIFKQEIIDQYNSESESFIVQSSMDTTQLFIRSVRNKNLRKFPFKKGDYELLADKGDYLIIKTESDKKVWLFTVSSGRKTVIDTVSSDETFEYDLYVSPDKKTVKLIEWSEKSLSIRTILENGINYANKGTLPVDIYTDKGRGFTSIDIRSGMLEIQLNDESYMLLFLDGRKNKFPYLAEKIYLDLTQQERERYGLGKKETSLLGNLAPF